VVVVVRSVGGSCRTTLSKRMKVQIRPDQAVTIEVLNGRAGASVRRESPRAELVSVFDGQLGSLFVWKARESPVVQCYQHVLLATLLAKLYQNLATMMAPLAAWTTLAGYLSSWLTKARLLRALVARLLVSNVGDRGFGTATRKNDGGCYEPIDSNAR
jgi:hypothetical protein